METSQKKLINLIEMERLKRKMKKWEFCQWIGIHPSAYSHVLKGEQKVSAEMILKLEMKGIMLPEEFLEERIEKASDGKLNKLLETIQIITVYYCVF